MAGHQIVTRGHIKTCPVCETKFQSPPSSAKKYCSSECRKTLPGGATTHAESRHRLHRIWCGMKTRCHGSNAVLAKKYYRDRGIQVCQEWRASYETFRDWAIANGYGQGLQIDRIDVNGNYEPTNCRWVTRHQQMRNTRVHKKKNKTSRFRGVQRMAALKTNPWRAFVTEDGKMTHLGVFPTEESAAKAHDKEALRRFGEFASLNFPEAKEGA